jgi:hypothetical protein
MQCHSVIVSIPYHPFHFDSLGGGAVAITAVAYRFLTSQDRRQTWEIGVSIGVHGRRVTGPFAPLSVQDGRVLMAVRQ